MKKKSIKTNAMRILDQKKIAYVMHEYETDGSLDGVSVAHLLNENPDHVFKTIVLQNNQSYYVAVIPVAEHIDLKACARAFNVKKLELLHVSSLFDLTGYVRGGCSPIGMKKRFPTCIHNSACSLETMTFSGGRIGTQIQMSPFDLSALINATFEDIIARDPE